MLIEAYRSMGSGFVWLDLSDPTGEELQQITEQYALPPEAVRECLLPKHLPKVEVLESTVFILLRAYDERSKSSGTIQGLTRKIAIFLGKNYLITIHRSEQTYIAQIRNAWVKQEKNLKDHPSARLLVRILQGMFSSYGEALYRQELVLEEFESKIFNQGSTQSSIKQKFLVKRKIAVIKRMLKMTLALMTKYRKHCSPVLAYFREVREFGEMQFYTAEEVLESVNHLINLQLSLASHQTSEVVRVLTLFSVFFLPMSFIAGIYGMNFKHMPELDFPYSYPMVLLGMLTISGVLFWYFKRKQWIKW